MPTPDPPADPDRPALLIRRAEPDDSPAINRLKVETWRSAYRGLLPDSLLDGLDPEDAAAFRRRGLEAISPERVAFVADRAGSVVGFVTGGRERSGEHPAYRGEVYAIYVVASLQRQGIGTALIRAAVGELVQRGLATILIWTLYDNPRSRAWYEAQGGVVVGEKRGRFEGYELHEVGYGWTDPAPLLSSAEPPGPRSR